MHTAEDQKRFNFVGTEAWEPEDRATLLFVIKNDQVLLIHKKRGLGKGKINGPGGRIEAGETPKQAAVREVQEECCITPSGITECGYLAFQFKSGYSIACTVFKASDYEGTPRETDEAIPIWTPLDAIPYEKMWADDEYWIPAMLEGRRFDGTFLFDDDRMVLHEIHFSQEAS